jgi:uncharacterized protein YecE (DUF72 family)
MSGFSYKEWRGSFYPAAIPHDAMLGSYASRFPAVEINSTFYRMPRESVLAGWASQVPEGFRFCIKASQGITHHQRLQNVQDLVEYLLQAVTALGERRGPVLFQCPPNLKRDLPRLEAFLALLPRSWKFALQLRHASWFEDDAVLGMLRERDIALVAMEQDDWVSPVEATASWGYVRLHRPGYTAPELEHWRDRIRAQPWSEAYVFFQHEEGIAGPSVALQFQALLSQ